MSAADDKDLIQRMAARDQSAMSVLYARHSVRVYRYLVRLTRIEATAEEIMNEVFLEAWRTAEAFQGRSSVSTWLMAIAHHKAVSVLRKRSEYAMDEAALACCPDDADTPEVATQKRNKAEVMRACMEQLSHEHRAIIDLVYYHDKSVAEAAEITGVPVATVKTRMFYARKKLAELMREAGLDRGWP